MAEKAPVYRVKKRCILIGDGVKQPKEAFHMAGVKKLLQESEERSERFTKASVYMYGEKQEVSYYCIDLLWGQKLYQELRFVLVLYNGSKSVLVSTDLSLSPKRIIELYAYRFSIEELFREFNFHLQHYSSV